MSKLIVKDRSGTQHELDVERLAKLSVMEIIRDSGAEQILALCGGCCSCSTCHIYVDEADLDRLPAMSDDENDLLEMSENRTPFSRLSCQIQFREELDGLKVAVAPEE